MSEARSSLAIVGLVTALLGGGAPARASEPSFAGETGSTEGALSLGPPRGAASAEIEADVPEGARYEEYVEVVGESGTADAEPAELPVRPAEVMAVAGAVDNVFRTLQTLPGIAGTSDLDSRISVRGGGPDENLTIMDGVEIHNPYRLFGLTTAFNPETVSRFDLSAGAFSAKYGDRLSSLLVVENRPGTRDSRFRGSSTMSLTDANALAEGRLPAGLRGSWLLTARRTYYDVVANAIADTELPAFGDLQGRADLELRPGTTLTLFGLRSREGSDALFEGDRAGEQGRLDSAARNDLAALRLRRLWGTRLVSTTSASFYVNRDELGVDARFRSDWRRSNAPEDDDGFRVANVAFTRDIDVRDLALRQEVAFGAGSHFLETGFELHRLRTATGLVIDGDRNPGAANGSSVRGGAGLPDRLDSRLYSTRAGAWMQDRFSLGERVSLEAGLRFDWSGLNRRSTLSPRLAATLRLSGALRLYAAGGLFTQSPGYEKLIQADYFADLSGSAGRSLRHERARHAVVGLGAELGSDVSARVEGYWKAFGDLVVGRLETEVERLARLTPYDFPDELSSSVPSQAIVTSVPENAGRGRSAGVDVFIQKRPSSRSRFAGWISYTYGVAEREEYGRTLPFDYDRRHALSLVSNVRLGPKWQVGTTLRAASGFPRTPVSGLRVAAEQASDGRLVPARDEAGRYVYETDAGGVENLNSARQPFYARLDLRLTWKPRGDAGRWLFYLDVINATNRDNPGTVETRLEHDSDSAADRPRAVEENGASIPLLPSFGLRFRF